MTIPPQNKNLNYSIDVTLTKGNRLFVLSFEIIEENSVNEDSFSHYYVPNVEMKNEEEAYKKIIEMSRNNYYRLVIYWILLIAKKITG